MGHLDLPAISAEPAVMRLAHPARFVAAQPAIVDQIRWILGPHTFRALSAAFADDAVLTTVGANTVAEQPAHHRMRESLSLVNLLPGGTEMGNASSFLLALRHHLKPAPYFRLDDELAHLLERTDIADDIPVGCLRPPYPRLYIEFGTARDIGLALPNPVSGQHILEGAYVEFGEQPRTGPSLYVMLTGSPIGKSNALDDATHAVLLPLSDEQRPLADALRWSFDAAADMARRSGLRESPATTLDSAFACLQYLAKALLYIGLAEARLATHPQRTEYLRQHAHLKSAAKRAKVERRARLLVDHILISAPPAPAVAPTSGAAGHAVRAHWRRGHYRMQPHGPQRQQRRLQWIGPVLVHGEVGHTVATPNYEVR